MRPARRIAVVILVVSAVGGCATRRPQAAKTPAPVEVPPSRDIEALIERGCFRCLEEAFALADARRLPQLAFEVASLLTLRATELGMPADTWMGRAKALAADDSTWTLYLEMVAAVPRDPLSGVRDDLLVENTIRSRARTLMPVWRDALAGGAGSTVFRRYLAIALTCSTDPPLERDRRASELIADLPTVPLLRYRVGLCSGFQASHLSAIQSDDPEFVDADYALGRYALENPEAPDQDEALRRFRSAAAAFPTSTAIVTSIANVYQMWEDWAPALNAFDAVLALLPTHPDAQLGRVISLSHLERHQEAIEAASTLINGGRWFLGQAFYWRAWNHFNMGNNPSARADADRTRSLMVNAAVFVLSGMIEWRLTHLEPAETEFQEAITMDFGQCDAAYYLGAVRSQRSKVPEAIAAMNQARQCYDLAIAVRRKAIERVNAGPGTPQSRAREVARHERAIAAAEQRRTEAMSAIEKLQKALK
jgi:tetratricopeptide (TPR) repeat protein